MSSIELLTDNFVLDLKLLFVHAIELTSVVFLGGGGTFQKSCGTLFSLALKKLGKLVTVVTVGIHFLTLTVLGTKKSLS